MTNENQKELDALAADVGKILAESTLPKDKSVDVMLDLMERMAPTALTMSQQAANGEFIVFLMQLLKVLLPILLKMLA